MLSWNISSNNKMICMLGAWMHAPKPAWSLPGSDLTDLGMCCQ